MSKINFTEVKKKRKQCIDRVKSFYEKGDDELSLNFNKAVNDTIKLIEKLPDIAIHLIKDVEEDLFCTIQTVVIDWCNKDGLIVACSIMNGGQYGGFIFFPNTESYDIVEPVLSDSYIRRYLPYWEKLYINPNYFD